MKEKAECQPASPRTHKQVCGIWGMAGFGRICVPDFGLSVKSLYDEFQGPETNPSEWDKACDQAFIRLKALLPETPALALPGLERPLDLYVQGRQGVAVGVLTQTLGALKRRVAYFSKESDSLPESCGSHRPFDQRGRENLWVSLQQSGPHTWSLVYWKPKDLCGYSDTEYGAIRPCSEAPLGDS